MTHTGVDGLLLGMRETTEGALAHCPVNGWGDRLLYGLHFDEMLPDGSWRCVPWQEAAARWPGRNGYV